MFIACLWHKTKRNILFLPAMKRATLKHILFTMLTTIMCFGFSSYVALSQYEVAKVVNININEEDSETAEKSLTELNSFYLHEDLLLNTTTTLSTSLAFHYRNELLSDFNLIPNTPPPNLA